MHLRTRLVAWSFVVLIVGLAFAPTARAAMDRPTWNAGDFWVYAWRFGSGGTTTNGTLRMDVAGSEAVNVNGTSYPSYHVTATVTIPFGSLSFTIPANVWFSVDTLAIVKIVAVVNLTFGNVSAGSTTTVSGNPPQSIHWPLMAGDSWSSSTLVSTLSVASNGNTTYASQSLTTDFLVQADAVIATRAGSFTTTPLKETEPLSGSYSINYWSPAVGSWARVEFYNSSGAKDSDLELTSYHYAGPGFLSQLVIGVPVWIWLALLVLILVGIVGVFAMRRRRPPVGVPPGPVPPYPPMPPQEPPMGPQGPPPGSPP